MNEKYAMKKWILVIAAILTLCSSVAMSAENDKGVSIYGLGSQQCGTYLSNHQEIDKNSYKGRASEIYAAYFHGLEWVQHGYYRRTNRYKISNRQEIDKNSYKGRASEIYAAYFHGLEWVQHGYYRRTNRYKIFQK